MCSRKARRSLEVDDYGVERYMLGKTLRVIAHCVLLWKGIVWYFGLCMCTMK